MKPHERADRPAELDEVVDVAWRCWVEHAAASCGPVYAPAMAVLTAGGELIAETLSGTWIGLEDIDDLESMPQLRVQARRFEPLVSRRINELDGVVAGVTVLVDSIWRRGVHEARETWLGAASSDGRSDLGILGLLSRNDAGRWIVPPPGPWIVERHVTFDDRWRAERLAGARARAVGTLNAGLRNAAKTRRRSRARR